LPLPVSLEDLHNTRSARNFWVQMAGLPAWSVTGNSAAQLAQQFKEDGPEEVTLEAGFLWHRLIRTNRELGLQAQVTNFVPDTEDQVELMQVLLTNLSDQPVQLTTTAAIPIYGRSADDLRDHRHVTSLLHRIQCTDFGVLVRPTLSFDERGHLPNRLTYAVLGTGQSGEKPAGFYPLVEEFTGEGGALDWPAAIIQDRPPSFQAGQDYAGYEALGGVRFAPLTLQPGESTAFVLILAILEAGKDPASLVAAYGSQQLFEACLQKTQKAWQTRLQRFGLKTGAPRFDHWMRWVALQPTLRRLYGNSFLPAHDYGRGGRGWRDLWQDILALLLMESGDVSELLFGNFAGVRIDGSNATIIGSAPGEFKADRNNIPRVWMDHGAWPWLTTNLYLHQSGDLAFLLREQTYFKDHLILRSKEVDPDWQPAQGTQLRTAGQQPYYGSILEHLLVQHLVPFFNVGEHNLIRLEGAD
jgi:cellobiose phosphorylase